MAKILIVDDDRTLLRFISEYLEGEGFQVVTADRGTKALKRFYDERPDLVVLDLMMPGMDGWEVCARLRELSDTPVILLSAKSSETDKLRGRGGRLCDQTIQPGGAHGSHPGCLGESCSGRPAGRRHSESWSANGGHSPPGSRSRRRTHFAHPDRVSIAFCAGAARGCCDLAGGSPYRSLGRLPAEGRERAASRRVVSSPKG